MYGFNGWEKAKCTPVNEKYKEVTDPGKAYELLGKVWCEQTCAPRLRNKWNKDNKTCGQCSVTAFLMQDIFGGKVYGMELPNGDIHCYNVVDEVIFDLTSEQFGEEAAKLKYAPGADKEQDRNVQFAEKKEKKNRYEFLKMKFDDLLHPDDSLSMAEFNNAIKYMAKPKKNDESDLLWDKLRSERDNKTQIELKITEANKAGAVAEYMGIRGFIPSSKLALTFVENAESYVGKHVRAIIITAEEEDQKLVFSVKDILKAEETERQNKRVSGLPIGEIVSGKVERIESYGAFINLGEELTGLCHISEVCDKRIKHPGAVLKLGEEVQVKILSANEGKISLSIKAAKAVLEAEAEAAEALEEPVHYVEEEAPVTMGDLFKNIKLKK